MSDQNQTTEPTDGFAVEPSRLSDRQLFALITVELNAQDFINVDLKRAKAELAQAQNALSAAQAKVNEVAGAISGAEVLINRELSKAGVSLETYEEQKAAFFEAERAANEGDKESTPSPDAPVEPTADAPQTEEQPVAVTPKVRKLKSVK